MSSAPVQGVLWGRQPATWAGVIEPQMRPLYEITLDALEPVAGVRLLDAGCGAGLSVQIAAGRGARVSGLDASAPLLEIARTRTPGADLRVGDIEALPFEASAFDMVCAFNAIQYAFEPAAAVAGCRTGAEGNRRGRTGRGPCGPVRGARGRPQARRDAASGQRLPLRGRRSAVSGLVDRAVVPGAVSPSTPTGPEATKGTTMITATSRRAPLPRILAASAVLAGVLALTTPAVGTESPATVPAMQAVTARTRPSDTRVLSEERHAWARRMSAARRELIALRAAVRDVPSIWDSVRDRMQRLEWVSTGDVPVEGLEPRWTDADRAGPHGSADGDHEPAR